MIPYPDTTYTVEFHSQERAWQDEGKMLEVVSSFARNPAVSGEPSLPFAAVALGAGVGYAAWRLRRKS